MFSFKDFLLESVRQGLPHISTMDHKQFGSLIKNKKVHLSNMTEKTDGNSFVMGHDENGFYTQSTASGKEKMRSPEDYLERATRRTQEAIAAGRNPPSMDAARAFAHVHHILSNNQRLTQHLAEKHAAGSGEDVKVRGELLYRPGSKPGDRPGERKFVATSYSTNHMGKTGKIILHSRLPENQGHDLEHFKNHLSDEHINFDDDKIDHPEHHVDVSDEHKEFHGLNHELLNSRTTKTNKEAKEAEKGKLAVIQKKVADKVDSAAKSMNLQPKWSKESSEGIVVHPSSHNPEAPRFKITSDQFRQYRASDAAKWKK